MKNEEEIRWLQLANLNMFEARELAFLGSKLCKQFGKTIDFVVITGDLCQIGRAHV